MRPKSMVLILIALGCGLIASIGISQVMERNGAGDAKLATAPIYVAVIDISAGEELNASKIKLEEWPVDKIPEGAVRSPEQLDGKSPTQPMYAGEPLLAAKLADRDKIRGIAPKIRPGFRVMSINVDAASAVSGLIMPGDHVDVMVFTRGQNSVLDKAEAVLENIEVFAVNEQIHRDLDSSGNAIQARTVSLLVTPEQAQQLMYFNQIGVMSLSLRNPDELTSQTKVASTPPAPEPSLTPGLDAIKSLLPTLSAMVPMTAADDGPEFTMQIIQGGSGSVEEYNWDDRESLPRELQKPVEIQNSTELPAGISLEQLMNPGASGMPLPGNPAGTTPGITPGTTPPAPPAPAPPVTPGATEPEIE